MIALDVKANDRTNAPAVRYFGLPAGRVAAFVEISSGPTVLLIHGNSSSKEIFLRQMGMLRRRGFGIVAPDLPGHGASNDARRPARTYSFPGYASVLRRDSFGGLVAWGPRRAGIPRDGRPSPFIDDHRNAPA
jgi:pimeloyl-ACP methyl ester carboxylesterase